MKSRVLLLASLGVLACSGKPAPDAGFTGTWVVNVNGRPFMVLALDPEGRGYGGTLEQPNQWTVTGDGRLFSGIGREAATGRVTATAPGKASLRITANAPRSGDKQELEFSLTSRDEGRLKLADAPFDPWPVIRYAGSGTARVWTGWESKRSYALDEPYVKPNAEMAAIYQADQAPRQSLKSYYATAAQVDKDDAARREQVRVLIDKGQLRAAEDFRLAAMVFQHGSEPRDYLFAHTLALVALEKGDRCRPIEVGLFNVFVIERDVQVIDVNQIALNVKSFWRTDWLALVVDFNKFNARHQILWFFTCLRGRCRGFRVG